MTPTTFAEHYVRTDAGKAEIRTQTIKMSRPARNLPGGLHGISRPFCVLAPGPGVDRDLAVAIVSCGSGCRSAVPGRMSREQRFRG